MGLGLQWSGANDEMAQNIRQQIMDRLMAERQAKADAQQQFENQLKTKQFQSNEDLKNAQLAALQANRGNEQEDRLYRRAGDVAEQIPAGTELPVSSPVAGVLTAGGRGDLLTPKPDVVDAPPSALAADPSLGPQALPGTIANAPSPTVGRLVIKGTTQKQNEANIADTRKSDELKSKSDDLDQRTAAANEKLQQAWTVIQQRGETEQAKLALAQAAAEVSRVKAEAAIQHGNDVAAKTPTPIDFTDAAGNPSLGYVKDGKYVPIELPEGMKHNRTPAPEGWLDWLKRTTGFGPSAAPSAVPATNRIRYDANGNPIS